MSNSTKISLSGKSMKANKYGTKEYIPEEKINNI